MKFSSPKSKSPSSPVWDVSQKLLDAIVEPAKWLAGILKGVNGWVFICEPGLTLIKPCPKADEPRFPIGIPCPAVRLVLYKNEEISENVAVRGAS